MRRSFFLLSLISLLILAACAQAPGKQVACTMEAKLCPDGSSVGRSGPNCDFAACPAGDAAELSKSACVQDADCMCGGIDKGTNNCFVGNKEYAKEHVDATRDCPDFCTGIAGNFETRCVSGSCKNVKREQTPAPTPEPVPQEGADLSRAHWLCEDGTWKGDASECFDNKCLKDTECQMIGVKGICGPYKIAAPTSMHKPPIFYDKKCGKEPCQEIMAKCAAPGMLQPFYTGVACENQQCVLREAQGPKECDTADDCAPEGVCHPSKCIPLSQVKPSGMLACTMNCAPGTLDCGQGSCGCVNNRCVAQMNDAQPI